MCKYCCSPCKLKLECNRECCKKIPVKRYFLPLIGLMVLIWFEEFRHFVYLPIVVGVSFFIIFWNYPWLVYYTASKPLYYQDLFIDEKKLPNYSVSKKIRNKFQTILDWVLIITNTLLSAALADYWLYRINLKGYIEIIGVTGGIIKIFQIINNTISRIMLKILRSYIKEETIRYKNSQRDRISSIIKLKAVDDGLWKIMEEEKLNIEIKDFDFSKNSDFRPNRDRLATI